VGLVLNQEAYGETVKEVDNVTAQTLILVDDLQSTQQSVVNHTIGVDSVGLPKAYGAHGQVKPAAAELPNILSVFVPSI
jgi:hypothetical protein